MVKAITYNRAQLLVSTLLGFVITYLYSLIGYFYLNDAFWSDSFGENGENQCTSVFHCFTTLLSLVSTLYL